MKGYWALWEPPSQTLKALTSAQRTRPGTWRTRRRNRTASRHWLGLTGFESFGFGYVVLLWGMRF